jgi:glycosyltransferase involved in cell wall biosynthesis
MWSKNLELAVDAWLRFKPSPSQNRFQLIIAGMVDAKSRAYLVKLRAIAQDRSDISFVESPSEDVLASLYQRCHAVLFTAPNEDWGLVPLEAMACGKPVVATDRGGPRETVVDGETGFLMNDEPTAFAMAIRHLAGMSAADLDEMGRTARRRAENFTWDGFVDQIDRQLGSPAAVTPELLARVGS